MKKKDQILVASWIRQHEEDKHRTRIIDCPSCKHKTLGIEAAAADLKRPMGIMLYAPTYAIKVNVVCIVCGEELEEVTSTVWKEVK